MNLLAVKGQNRLRLVVGVFLCIFMAIGGKLIALTTEPQPVSAPHRESDMRLERPPIIDRNGEVLATDIPVPSLFADPRKIIDVDEAVELLTATLPGLDAKDLREKLSIKPGQRPRRFVWIKRSLTEGQRLAVYRLGLPGLDFVQETMRFYPKGKLAAHVLGYVDVDNRGLAGMEKYFDGEGALFAASLAEPGAPATQPAALSIDLRVQHALTDELEKAISKFSAMAAVGIILDIHSGEVLAAASLPDFDPRNPIDAQKPSRLNRFTGGSFELGSVLKTVTFAMALDAGTAHMDSRYDARQPVPIGRYKINDFHAQNRILSLPEVFTYSSNIGTVHMADQVGVKAHLEFLKKVGLTERLQTELPEAASPQLQNPFTRAASYTTAYGHGFAIEPMQLAQVAGALMNGGILIPPTFLKRDESLGRSLGERIISEQTSAQMRYLFRLNVQKGTGGKADVPGYRVGGKTGTAQKVSPQGGYDPEARINSFLAAFPMEAPRYVLLVVLDDPKPTEDSHGYATAGYNAVPTAGAVIARVAPILGVEPDLSDPSLAKLVADGRKHDIAAIADTGPGAE